MINNAKQADNHTLIEYSYEEALDILEDEIEKILSTSPKIIREYTMHLGKSFGKLMRAKSILICAENEQGFVLRNAIILATAIELLHLATLVHDDVIDRSDMRRGKVTLQKKYGNRTAVICGDYLLSVALKMVAAVSDKEKYLDKKIPDFVGNICLGFCFISRSNFAFLSPDSILFLNFIFFRLIKEISLEAKIPLIIIRITAITMAIHGLPSSIYYSPFTHKM